MALPKSKSSLVVPPVEDIQTIVLPFKTHQAIGVVFVDPCLAQRTCIGRQHVVHGIAVQTSAAPLYRLIRYRADTIPIAHVLQELYAGSGESLGVIAGGKIGAAQG